MSNKPTKIEIKAGTVVMILMFLILGWILYEIRDIILIIITAIIFSSALSPGKKYLTKFKIPEPIAVILLYIFAFLVLGFFVYSIFPVLVQQYQIFLNSIPNIIETIKDLISGTIFQGLVSESFFISDPNQIKGALQGLVKITSNSVSSIFGSLVNIILFLLLTFLFMVNPKSLDNFLCVVTPHKYRDYVSDLWNRSKIKMAQWFQGQLLLVFIIAAMVYLALIVIGVPNALFLALFAGLMELIPIFGPFIGAVPAILMALTTGDPTLAVLVIIIFIVIQQVENNLIYPLVVSKVVGVSSTLVILSIVIGGSIAGLIGVIIAVPLAAIIHEFFEDVRIGTIKKIKDNN